MRKGRKDKWRMEGEKGRRRREWKGSKDKGREVRTREGK